MYVYDCKMGGVLMENKENSYENDSLKDVIDTQNNIYNPGHYIGTGRVPTTVSAPGNATPLAIVYFIFSALIFVVGLVVFIRDDASFVSGGLIESALANEIIGFVILTAFSIFLFIIGLGYLRKGKRYYKMKSEMENEAAAEMAEDEDFEEVDYEDRQRLCPECNRYHDIDYPKCPYCKYDYSKRFR